MKKIIKKILVPLLAFLIAVTAVFIGIFYFRYISKRISQDSSTHLTEIYDQVNRSLSGFIQKNWGILSGWDKYFDIAEEQNPVMISDFVKAEQDKWGFTEFYFLNQNGDCMNVEGKKDHIQFYSIQNDMKINSDQVMAGGTISTGQDITIFSVPASRQKYKDFSFDAIAISYNNADIADSLNVNAFSGEAKCFVVRKNGDVLLSTQSGGNVYSNYLTYLKGASDIDDAQIELIKKDWSNSVTGLFQCNMGDTTYSILYQPIGYQDYILLSIVPQKAVSAGFLSVRKNTTNVLIAVFTLIVVSLIVITISQSYKRSRKNKMELQYRELMFDVLSNSVDDIFIMLDNSCLRVDYISPNIERLLGIPLYEVWNDIKVVKKYSENPQVFFSMEEMNAIPVNGNISREYGYIHHKTGECLWYRATVYHMNIQDVPKYIIVLSDRTLERQTNRQLQEALAAARSANEAKSNFLSNMSHDIRTPMNAIVGFSVLIEKDADKPDKVREYTRKITTSSHHLLGLINNVLDMSKIESGKTSLNIDRFSLPELLEEISTIMLPQAKAKNQHFKIRVIGAPPEQMTGDKLRLNQILINLTSNAIKYTPDGGNVSFCVSELKTPNPNYAKLRFVVEDNGIGMSKEYLQTIFDPFSREESSLTNKIQGTGLGMAITKNLVDLMGGIITVESELNKGSKFNVELSFALPEPEETDPWFKHMIKNILVADDDEQLCDSVKAILRDTGIDVTTVTSGQEAVEKAVQAHNENNDFHAILIDWKMPGMSGVESARAIREQTGQDVPIIALTSYDWADIEDEARAAGINAFMSKPFFLSTFWQALKPLFNEEADDTSDTDNTESIMKDKLFLVAEDNDLNAEILTEMLSIEGASCELAVNGKEAVEMFVNSEPGYYDMILMDVQMPVMNGYDATKEIRSSSHPEAGTIPIAAMTANTFAEDVRNALDAGMDGHLTKPIDMNAVRELVGKLLSCDKGD